MKLTADVKELRTALNAIKGAVGRDMPILGYALLTTGDDADTVMLYQTDLQTSIKLSFQAEVEEAGSVCLPTQHLLSLIREHDDSERVSLYTNGNDTVVVRVSKSQYKFNCKEYGPDDYPVWKGATGGSVVIKSSVLKETLDRTLLALNPPAEMLWGKGLLFHIRPDRSRLIVVGTNGHRLSAVSKKVEIDGITEETRVVIPKGTVEELQAFGDIAENTVMTIGEGRVQFTAGDRTIVSTLLDVSYPDYAGVMPKDTPNNLKISREAFVDVINRASVIKPVLEFNFSPDNSYVTTKSDEGEMIEDLGGEYSGEPLKIGFDARYLLEPLKKATAEVITLSMGNDRSAAEILTGDREWKYILMPIVLS